VVPTHATLWSGGTITDLGTLGGTNSYASDINNVGQVVGWSNIATTAGGPDAALWMPESSTAIDLSTRLDSVSGVGWTIEGAEGVNDLGQVVGIGINSLGQERHVSQGVKRIARAVAFSPGGEGGRSQPSTRSGQRAAAAWQPWQV
jgi:probable HAF family extracellular repeat protein